MYLYDCTISYLKLSCQVGFRCGTISFLAVFGTLTSCLFHENVEFFNVRRVHWCSLYLFFLCQFIERYEFFHFMDYFRLSLKDSNIFGKDIGIFSNHLFFLLKNVPIPFV